MSPERRMMDDRLANCDPRSASVSRETLIEGPYRQGSKMKYEYVRATTTPAGRMHPISSKTRTGSPETEPTSVPDPDRERERRTRRVMTMNMQPLSESLGGLTSELPFAFNGPVLGKKSGAKKNLSRRPNYFVSIPVTNVQISSAVVEIQEAVLRQEPRLAKAMIPAPTLHITLLVTHLANQEQVEMAAAALAQLEPSLAELLGGRDLVLSFSGIGQFTTGKGVVFMDLEAGPQRDALKRLAKSLRSHFKGQGILSQGGDRRRFEPHLTIMKLSRAPTLHSQGLSCVDPALYSRYADGCFGEQTVERLDLCSMLKPKQKNGYYHTESSLPMLKTKQENGYYHTESSLTIDGRGRSEPDEAKLPKVGKRLVKDASNRALQQYKQKTLKNGGDGASLSYIRTEEGTENPRPLYSMKVARPALTEVHPPSRFGHQLDDNRLYCHSLSNRECASQTTCSERVEPFGRAVNFLPGPGLERAVPELATRQPLLQPALPVLGAWGRRKTTAGHQRPLNEV